MTDMFNPDGSVAEDFMPPKLVGSGPKGTVTARDIQAARGITSAAGPGRRPPTLLRPVPFPWGRPGPAVPIDLYDLNPYVTIVRSLPAGDGITGEPPSMFSAGDLPIITASGVDPALLRFVPWSHRHSAAATGDRGEVFTMIEQAAELDQDTLQNRAGTERLEAYRQAVWAWATMPPPSDVMSQAEFEEWTYGTDWEPK